MADLSIRQGDTAPALTWPLTDSNGDPLDLTGATTVTFVMRTLTAASAAVNAACTIVGNPTQGLVTYQWQAGDTATAGLFMGEFHVTQTDGTHITSPAGGYVEISIEQNLTTPGGATIVSLTDVKEHLKIPPSNRQVDAKLIRYITGSARIIEGIVGPVLQRSVTEWHDGGTNAVVLRQRPTVSITSVTEWRGPVPYVLTAVADPGHGTTYSYLWEPENNRIVRRTAGGGTITFPGLAQSVQVIYVTGRAAVPEDIRFGTLELIRTNWIAHQQQGLGHGGQVGLGNDDDAPTQPMLGFFVPNSVREILAPSKRAPSIA